MKHLAIDDILAYLSRNLPLGDRYNLEAHIADCDECAQTVRCFLILKETDGILESLTLRECAKALIAIRLGECISEVPPEFAERIQPWIKNIDEIDGAMAIKMDPSLKKMSLNPEGMKSFTQFGKAVHFSPVQQIQVCGEETEELVKSVRATGEQGEEVTVYGSPGQAILKIESAVSRGPSPTAVLLRLDRKEIYVNEAMRVPGTSYSLARYEGLPKKGDYVLLWQSSRSRKKL